MVTKTSSKDALPEHYHHGVKQRNIQKKKKEKKHIQAFTTISPNIEIF